MQAPTAPIVPSAIRLRASPNPIQQPVATSGHKRGAGLLAKRKGPAEPYRFKVLVVIRDGWKVQVL